MKTGRSSQCWVVVWMPIPSLHWLLIAAYTESLRLFFSRFLSKPLVRFISSVSASRKTLLRLLDMIVAISRAASILLKSRKAGERVRASPRSLAACASPVALIIVDLLSWMAYSTRYFARSACCWAICFSSIAFVNSGPKCKSVIDTSSSTI